MWATFISVTLEKLNFLLEHIYEMEEKSSIENKCF